MLVETRPGATLVAEPESPTPLGRKPKAAVMVSDEPMMQVETRK